MEKSGVTPHYLHRDSLTSKLFFVCGLIVIAVLVCITVKLGYFTIAIFVDCRLCKSGGVQFLHLLFSFDLLH